MNKLTQEELERLHKMQSDFTKAKVALGDIELEKHELLKKIDFLRAEFSEFEKTLIAIYGDDSVINMQTGEVTKKK
jgi:septal ring factor EnvC (AmiA/AmiB activator)